MNNGAQAQYDNNGVMEMTWRNNSNKRRFNVVCRGVTSPFSYSRRISSRIKPRKQKNETMATW